LAVLELVTMTKRYGDVVAVDNVSFEVEKGQIISLLGPSGCGKTTTLRVIAGFETPDAGKVIISGQDVTGKRPYERNVGLLFQDYALFPHMTVEENIAYGMRHRGVPRPEIPARTERMLSLVKLEGFDKRRPTQLSGGQQQRVALARALATEPEVVLLDEPLSALDAKLRQELRMELKEILSSVDATTIVVTHDQEEAMSLTEDVIVMKDGQIAQRGTPTEIHSRPVDKFVAEFVGRSNWLSGTITGKGANGLYHLQTGAGLDIVVREPVRNSGETIDVCVRPERIELVRGNGRDRDTSPEDANMISGVVVDAANLGSDIHIFVDIPNGPRMLVIEKNIGQKLERPGCSVDLRFPVDDCLLFFDGKETSTTRN